MLNAQENECRAKEAESLEQAKQTNDKDLKHLHETIARQWRRLAEGIETGPANTSVGCESPEVPSAQYQRRQFEDKDSGERGRLGERGPLGVPMRSRPKT